MRPPAPSLRILLVDDSPVVRDVLVRLLEALGHRVTAAEDARRALGLLAEGLPVDLVLTDYRMPGMNGLDLAREIRGRWPALLLGLISGTAEGVEIPAGLFERILTKPVTLRGLQAALAGLPPTAPSP